LEEFRVPTVSLPTPNGSMPTYVAVPEVPPPWPGVVVIHDFTGMSHDLRNQADWLASEGFLAAAADLYHWGGRWRCLRTVIRDLAEGRGRTFDDLEVVRDWLVARNDCSGKIGVIGFCMGGGYALALAPGHGFDVASVNYGGCPTDAEAALATACPIVGSYGAKDRSPLGARAAVRLEDALTHAQIDHDVKIYPGAGHGFLNDHDPTDQTLLLTVLARLSGTRYDPVAASDARRRIVTFFDRHLQTKPAT
jgi:carboxymethylenebutenolidase